MSIPTKQVAKIIKSHPTNVLCITYQNRYFIIVTQYQKLGTVVHLTRSFVPNEIQETTTPIISTKVLLGKDEPLTHILAKNLTSEMNIDKPVIISIALKDTSMAAVSEIKHIVKECIS